MNQNQIQVSDFNIQNIQLPPIQERETFQTDERTDNFFQIGQKEISPIRQSEKNLNETNQHSLFNYSFQNEIDCLHFPELFRGTNQFLKRLQERHDHETGQEKLDQSLVLGLPKPNAYFLYFIKGDQRKD